MAKPIKYNLSGHGQLTLYVFPYAEKLFDILSERNYDAKFNLTNQLGALKRVLPGAHYTRYEYILLQWYLIFELSKRSQSIGLSSSSAALKALVTPELKAIGYEKLTGADYLQCLVLLSNMGHFPDTFAASRVWLNLLNQKDLKLSKGLLSGLSVNERNIARGIMTDCNVHVVHHLNSLFMLNRLGNTQAIKPFSQFASNLMLEYRQYSNEGLNRYINMFATIRKLAYLILDSSYAPIPLNIELSSVVSNMEQIFSQAQSNSNPMSNAIKQIDKVLEDSVYLSGNSLIATSIRSNELETNFYEYLKRHADESGVPLELQKISVIRDILEPKNKTSNSLAELFNQTNRYETPPINWDIDNCLVLKYSHTKIYDALFNREYYEWEKEMQDECGRASCFVAVFSTPARDHLRFVYSRNIYKPLKLQFASLCKFVARISDSNLNYEKEHYANDHSLENSKAIFEFMLKGCLEWGFSITFEWNEVLGRQVSPFFVGYGTKTVASKIREYIGIAQNHVNADTLHEFNCTEKVLMSKNYRGLVLTFIGATKVWKSDSSTPVAEFDGVILYPNGNGDIFIDIVEGKNKSNGHTEARSQLTKRMELLNDAFEFTLTDIARMGAYASIKPKV